MYMRYWPSVRSKWLDIMAKFFVCFCEPRRSRGQKKRKDEARYSAKLAEQAWSMKDLFYGQNEIRTKRTISRGRKRPILLAR